MSLTAHQLSRKDLPVDLKTVCVAVPQLEKSHLKSVLLFTT